MNSSMTAMYIYIYIYADTNMFCLLMTAPVKTACPTRERCSIAIEWLKMRKIFACRKHLRDNSLILALVCFRHCWLQFHLSRRSPRGSTTTTFILSPALLLEYSQHACRESHNLKQERNEADDHLYSTRTARRNAHTPACGGFGATLRRSLTSSNRYTAVHTEKCHRRQCDATNTQELFRHGFVVRKTASVSYLRMYVVKSLLAFWSAVHPHPFLDMPFCQFLFPKKFIVCRRRVLRVSPLKGGPLHTNGPSPTQMRNRAVSTTHGALYHPRCLRKNDRR